MPRQSWRWLGAALWLGGCFSETSVGGTGPDASTGTPSETTQGCTPGAETCACMEGGRCEAGLICASQLCVDLGGITDPSASGDSGEGGGTAKTTDDGGDETTAGDSGDTGIIGEPGSCVDACGLQVPHFDGMCFCDPACNSVGDCCDDYEGVCGGECVFNSDCAAEQVCSLGGAVCVEVYDATYDIVVEQWNDHTPICWDGVTDCYADVYYDIYYGGNPEFTSLIMPDTVSATWTEPWSQQLDAQTVLTFTFSDSDTEGDEVIEIECFVGEDQTCGPVPAAVLHDGIMVWDPGDATFSVRVRFLAQ